MYFKKKKVFVWQDLNNYPRYPGGLILKIFNKTLGLVFQLKIASFIPKTNSSKKFLIKSGIPEDKIQERIPSGVNTNIFLPKIEFEPNKSNKSNKIIAIARLHEQKGLKYLILAMKEVILDYPNSIAIIKGKGPQYKELNELILKEHLEKNVLIDTSYSTRNELIDLYNSCSLIVLPSIFETIGFVLLEGMSCGKPIIASDINGPNEIVIHNNTGFLVPPKSKNELAKYIKICLGDDNLREKMGLSAREIALSDYDWNSIAQKFVAIFSESK